MPKKKRSTWGWEKTELECPYCRQKFKAGELHFFYHGGVDNVLDDVELRHIIEANAAQAAEAGIATNPAESGAALEAAAAQKPEAPQAEQSKPVEVEVKKRSNVQGAAAQRDEQPPAEEQQPAAIGQNIEQVFGDDNSDDAIGRQYLDAHHYLENMFGASFVRRGRYMKIGSKELAEKDPAYAFVDKHDDKAWDGNTPRKVCFFTDVNGRKEMKTAETRLCPHCHIDLPDAYFGCLAEERVHAIAMAGGTSSGKTLYITMALNCMMNSWGNFGMGTVQVELNNWFLRLAINRLENGLDIASTQTRGLLPFIVKHTLNGVSNYLIIYDVAGEYANDGQDDYVRNASFRKADVLMLMIDASHQKKDEVDEDAFGAKGAHTCTMNLDQCITPLTKIELHRDCKKIVGVVTKMDLLIKQKSLAEGKGEVHGNRNGLTNGLLVFEGDMSMHNGAVDLSALKRMDREMDNLFDLKDKILNLYGGEKDVSCELNGVSTWKISVNSDPDNYTVSKKLVVKGQESEMCGHRLLEPLLRIMADLGILNAKNGEPRRCQSLSKRKRLARKKA